MRNDIRWNGNEALGYFRCSKDEQADSIPGQHMIVDPELARYGLRMRVAPFEDDGRRGSDEERPAFLALLDYCRAHPLRPRTAADFVPIFTQSTDRIGRFLQPMKLFTYLNELRDLGYDMYSITEGITYVRSNIGEWIQFVVRSDQATGYSVRLSHDSMRGGIQTSKLGFLAGGSPGYGFDRAVVGPDGVPRARYRNIAGKRVEKYSMDGQLLLVLKPIDKKGKLIAPTLDKSNTDHVIRIPGEEIKVKAVARLFEVFEEGKGLRTVASTLNMEGYPPAQGRKWVSSSVRSILTNPIYYGLHSYGRRSKSKYHEFSVEKGDDAGQFKIEKKEIFRKEFVYREIDECITQENAHPAIVSKERWFKCQELLSKKAVKCSPKKTGRGARSPYLLTGLIKCDRCGYSFQGDTHRRTGWRSYQCGGYIKAGHSICVRQTVPAEKIENWVIGEMGQRLLDGRAGVYASYEDFERAIWEAVGSQAWGESPDESRRKMLEGALADKRKKIELILTGLAADNLDVANEMIRTLKHEIATLESELASLRTHAPPAVKLDPKAVAREAATYLWHLKDVIEQGTMEERRKIVAFFVEGAKINGVEGWVEATFYENPKLAAQPVSFCMVPPTRFELVFWP